MNRRTATLKDAVRKALPVTGIITLMTIADPVIFFLYDITLEPFLFCLIGKILFGLIFLIVYIAHEFYRADKRHRIMSLPNKEWSDSLMSELQNGSLEEKDYCSMISQLSDKLKKADQIFDSERRDMVDYYTAWVHQIKTPISVMQLELKEKDTETSRALLSELFRIERYVDMVLQYIRLGSSSNDLVIREYDLEELIRDSVRKYASQFVASRVGLDLHPISRKIVTDRKWFAVIIEQILSNAIKYSPEGRITIDLNSAGELKISDNGMGICKEDLPRIFEKGYTGNNGRQSVNSSGLGLYLCKSAADKLCIPLRAESAPGEGASFILDLSSEKKILF